MISTAYLAPNQDPFRVNLSLFEGPLDLLLHLIQEQKIEIADIPIAHITSYYLNALSLMQELDLSVAGDYLVMASTLILIKSRMLLPVSTEVSQDVDSDPRNELAKQLQEYRLFREAGSYLQNQQEMQSLVFAHPSPDGDSIHKEWILDATLLDLLRALRGVMAKHSKADEHIIIPGFISIREKMSDLLKHMNDEGPILFNHYFQFCKSRLEAIVSFLAILELVRMHLIHIRQKQLWADILITPLRVTTQEVLGASHG